MNLAGIGTSFVCALVILTSAGCGPSKPAGDRETALAPAPESHAPARGSHGEVIVHLDKEAQSAMGIVLARAAPLDRIPEFVAYGRVISDPASSFTVRAPIAGVWIASGSLADGPALGSSLEPSANGLGAIKPRLTAVERGDVTTRLAAARGELESARTALPLAQSALARTRALNADDKNASDRALEEAEGRVKTETARVAAAEAAVEALKALLEPGADQAASVPIAIGRAGTVVEVLAHPGESVESGTPLVRLENFARCHARIDMPLAAEAHVAAESIRIAAVGREDHFIAARLVGPAASVDVASPGGSFVYAFEQTAAKGEPAVPILRPGQAITAFVPAGDKPQHGFAIPRAAVVRFAGKTWIYDASGDGEFTRREIDLGAPIEQGWFVTAPWGESAQLVVTGAAELLSEEILGTQSKHGEEP